MATLKLIATRLKSIKNIQKITKSMKMIAAARYAKAERDLRPARSYGVGARALYEKAELEPELGKPEHLIIGISSDRGLCGGIHSSVAKAIRASVNEKPEGVNCKIVCVGDKIRTQLVRTHRNYLAIAVNEYGRKSPSFVEASKIAAEILSLGDFDAGEIHFNRFKTVVSYNTSVQPLVSMDTMKSADTMTVYDDVDEDILKNYNEFQLASILYYCMMESSCSEQSSRMTAMDSATKNAGEMIDKLTLKFNRTRQSVITRELIEIISGAAALE